MTEEVRFDLSFNGGIWQEIAEPIGFDDAKFELKQEEGRYGRDVFFSDTDYEFSPLVEINGLTHRFQQIIQQYKLKGFETDIRLSITIDSIQYVIGQLDFRPDQMETDLINYIKCPIIQDTHQAIIKRHFDTNIDVHSDKDVHGNYLDPVETEKIFLEAMYLNNQSKWIMPERLPIPSASPSVFFSPATQIVESSLEHTLVPFSGWIQLSDVENPILKDFAIFQAKDPLVGVMLRIRAAWYFEGSAACVMRIKKGDTFETSEYIYLEDVDKSTNDFSLDLEIDTIDQSEHIYLYMNVQDLSGNPGFEVSKFEVTLEGTEVTPSTIVNGVKLGRLMQHTVKSISGKTIDAPRFFEEDGVFSNQFVFSGNDLRNNNKPFNISFKTLVEYFPECNIDYQIKPDGTVFFGIERDFYEDDEIHRFEQDVLEGYKEYPNRRFAINRFSYKYKDYEKGKNNPQRDSLLGVATDVEWSVPNRMVEGSKDIEIDFARDSFLIEKTRKDAFLIENGAASEDDDSKFILDTVKAGPYNGELRLYIQNIFKTLGSGRVLELISDGNINWTLFGLVLNQNVLISFPEIHRGLWRVTHISTDVLHLSTDEEIDGATGIYRTMISWYMWNVERENRTTQGLINTNIEKPYSNLMFSPKSNVVRFYDRYLASAFFYTNDKILRNQKYINGGDVIAYYGIPNTDGEQDADIGVNTLGAAYLEPVMFEAQLICKFSDYMGIVNLLRTDRKGYVTVIDTEGNEKRGHPTSMVYDYNQNILTLTAEKRIIY